MHRPRLAQSFLLAPIMFTLVFFSFACSGGGAEKGTLDNFFRASKMRDNGTLANIATVAFDPKTNGTMESFSVTSVSEEQVKPLELKALAKEFEDARQADEKFTKDKIAFQEKYADDLKAYQDSEKKGQKPKKISAEFQTAWPKWIEDTKTSSKKLSEAREKLSVERGIADISVFNPQNPVDPTQYDGEMATKTYTIAAKVLTPDGQHVDKTLVITLQQARLKGDKPITGKWIITKIDDQAAAGKTS